MGAVNVTGLPAEELIRLQIELEYTLTPSGDLVPFPDSSEQARFIIHHHATGYCRFYRHNLPSAAREALAALSPERAFEDHGLVQGILEPGGEPAIFTGESCYFLEVTTEDQPAGVSRIEDKTGRTVLAVTDGDEVVSACVSVRENEASAEAWVYTEPDYRRHGYATKVVQAWANQVMSQGKIAFYSYALDNKPSRRLAQKLALSRFSSVVAYD